MLAVVSLSVLAAVSACQRLSDVVAAAAPTTPPWTSVNHTSPLSTSNQSIIHFNVVPVIRSPQDPMKVAE